MRAILYILFISLSLFACQQERPNKTKKTEYLFSIVIGGCDSCMTYLAEVYGNKNNVIDSAKTDNNGKVQYHFVTKNKYNGMYRLMIHDKSFIDFIFDKEDIFITTTYPYLSDSAQIIVSNENKVFFDFLKTDKTSVRKLKLLMQMIDNYPKDDSFFRLVAKEFNVVQKNREEKIKKIISDNPNTFLSHILKTQQNPHINIKYNENERKAYIKEHFFDNINFSDTLLLHSNIFTYKTINYLLLYTDETLSRFQQEKAFIVAVDVVLSKASINKKVYRQVLEYIMRGFEEYHYDKVLQHISSNYSIKTSCENAERKSTLQRRLDSYNKLVPGKKAPDIQTKDSNGKTIILSQINNDYTLVLFWASWCDHCNNLLPSIKKISNSKKISSLEVLAISLDTNLSAWKTAVAKEKQSYINCCDGKGWASKPADDYCIYATPTMFLLDKNKIILNKPITADELLSVLKQRKIVE